MVPVLLLVVSMVAPVAVVSLAFPAVELDPAGDPPQATPKRAMLAQPNDISE